MALVNQPFAKPHPFGNCWYACQAVAPVKSNMHITDRKVYNMHVKAMFTISFADGILWIKWTLKIKGKLTGPNRSEGQTHSRATMFFYRRAINTSPNSDLMLSQSSSFVFDISPLLSKIKLLLHVFTGQTGLGLSNLAHKPS